MPCNRTHRDMGSLYGVTDVLHKTCKLSKASCQAAGIRAPARELAAKQVTNATVLIKAGGSEHGQLARAAERR